MPPRPKSKYGKRTRPGDRGRHGVFYSMLGKSFQFDSLWERRRMVTLDLAGFRFVRENTAIPYMFENQRHRYYPDLLVFDKWGRPLQLEEIKPRIRVNDPINKAKFAAAEAWCAQRGIRFVIITEKNKNELPLPLTKMTIRPLDKSSEQ